jgi:hypothetical protein
MAALYTLQDNIAISLTLIEEEQRKDIELENMT